MSLNLKDEQGTIEINMLRNCMKGSCKAGKWKEHFEKVKEVFR